MTPDQTAALLPQILADSRVKAYGEGRGWYERGMDCVHGCGFTASRPSSTPKKFVWGCGTCGEFPFREQKVRYRYTGPDLALDSNLHELLGLADSLSHHMLDLTADQGVFYATIYTETPMETVEIWRGEGPTRTLAVLAALGRALNINTGDTP